MVSRSNPSPDDWPEIVVIGRNIRLARRSRNWTQAELGRRAGLGQEYLSAVEQARVPAGLQNLILIARALQIELKELTDPDLPARLGVDDRPGSRIRKKNG